MIDSHCHLADPVFAADLAETVGRARAAGLEGALCILSADEPDELTQANVVQAAWPAVRLAAGIHPHRSGAYADRLADVPAVAVRALEASGAVALGEIGLDYHYDLAPRPVQHAVFRAQIEVALERGLPVVIHTREAGPDTLAILREAGPGLRFVLHCFTGSPDEAAQAVATGGYISISGIATFPRAGSLRDVAAAVPADRLLIETDAPFLAPVPHRGKRNEPAWVAQTYTVVAGARGVTPAALAETVVANYHRFLGTADVGSPR